MEPGPVIVMTTVEARSDLGRRLVEERLAACVQEPIASTYRWQGEVTRAEELLLLINTGGSRRRRCAGWSATTPTTSRRSLS